MSPPLDFFAKKSLHIKNSVSFLENKTLLSQKINCFVPFLPSINNHFNMKHPVALGTFLST